MILNRSMRSSKPHGIESQDNFFGHPTKRRAKSLHGQLKSRQRIPHYSVQEPALF